MNSRLRVFVPAALVAEADRAAELLETLSELCPRYELAVVHDDEEAEAARALATCYPQVRAVAHPLNATLVAALEPLAAGDLVFAAERLGDVRPRAMERLSAQGEPFFPRRHDRGGRPNLHAWPDRAAVHAGEFAFHLA